jgi:hypothetical protein
MLWNNSQETWRDFLNRCYKASAGQLRLNMESAADEVVKLHNSAGAQQKTGQHFNPASVTEANRLKANCAALQRFMEKEDAIEMLPYILGAMSPETRLAFANQYLNAAGLTVHLADHDADDGFDMEAAIHIPSVAAKAFDASIAAAKNPTPQNLEHAEREVANAHVRFGRIRAKLKGARERCKNAIQRMCNKERV